MQPFGFEAIEPIPELGAQAGDDIIVRGPGRDILIQHRRPDYWSGLILQLLVDGKIRPIDPDQPVSAVVEQLRQVVGAGPLPPNHLRLIR